MYTPQKQKHYNPETNSNRHHYQCVCQICTCGKHSCPQPSLPFNAETSYHSHYKPYQLQKDQRMSPINYIPNSAKFQGKTSYQQDYSPKPIERSYGYQAQQYLPNRVPFTGTTTYDSEYRPHRIQIQPRERVNYQPLNGRGPLLGQSRYKQDYKAYKCERVLGCAVDRLPARPTRCSPGKNHLRYSPQKSSWE